MPSETSANRLASFAALRAPETPDLEATMISASIAPSASSGASGRIAEVG